MGSTQNEHIVMLPFMAQGHLIPFLALAKQIHHRTDFTITIANTPLNVNYLLSAVAGDPLLSQIHFAALPFNSADHGLPPNTENTESLPLTQIVSLFHASKSLETPFHSLVSGITEKDGRPPICIISDIFMGWAKRVADNNGTTNVSFTTGGAYGTSAYVSIWQNLPHRCCSGEGSGEFSVPGFPDSTKFHPSQLHQFLRAADGTDPWSLFFQPQISLSMGSIGWLVNTAEEIEILGVEVLRKYLNLPIWTIGPLLPQSMIKPKTSPNPNPLIKHTGREPGLSPEKCINWLDSQAENSVLYISFGSQNTISPTQMMELANGIEISGVPFIWAIRPPVGHDVRGEFQPNWLPEGFEERVKNRGLLIHKWAPQLEILSHKSTGVFLSHCGWNSTMESLSQGVPMIGWPLAAEQAYNSKMLMEDMGVSIELTRGVHSSVGEDEVRRVIEVVMDKEGKGGEMKRKAVEIGGLIRAAMQEEGGHKGSSLQAMDDFVSTLLSKRNGLSFT